MIDEQRQAERYPVVAEARLVSEDHPEGLFAIVRDISDTGCKLYGSQLAQASRHFVMIAREDLAVVEFECEVIWRSEEAMGVRFIGPAKMERVAP